MTSLPTLALAKVGRTNGREMSDRRTFLTSFTAALLSVAAARPFDYAQGKAFDSAHPSTPLGVTLSLSKGQGKHIRKAVLISLLPADLPFAKRFAMAREAGFDGIEMQTVASADAAAEIREASKTTGLHIHSVMNADHWRYPLSSGDPQIVTRSVDGMETSLRNAALWGADAVLLVPAVVDAATPYRDAWTRSQRVIRERLLPLAAELKVTIAIEEVWNKFLLSPPEFARYVDELDSPWVKAYFDVGNIVFYGYPQDWIRTLGSRIVKVHLKDFALDRPNGRFSWKNLGDGDIDWPEVRRALAEIDYRGYVTTEVEGGDARYLADLAARVDRFLSGERPT